MCFLVVKKGFSAIYKERLRVLSWNFKVCKGGVEERLGDSKSTLSLFLPILGSPLLNTDKNYVNAISLKLVKRSISYAPRDALQDSFEAGFICKGFKLGSENWRVNHIVP